MTDYSFITGEKPKKKSKATQKRKEKSITESYNDLTKVYKTYKKLFMSKGPKSWENEKDVKQYRDSLRKNPAYTHEMAESIKAKLKQEAKTEREIDYICQMKEWEYQEKQQHPSKFKRFVQKLRNENDT